jgi:methylated-DNA-[protein]-cysteine S-methyltransferase
VTPPIVETCDMSAIATPIETSLCDSPLGMLLLAAEGDRLVGVWFEDQPGIPGWALSATRAPLRGVMAETLRQLNDYLAGERKAFNMPLRIHAGTPFQRSVWQALEQIPYGQTTTYANVAQAIGKPSAVRAVGGAIGRNPIGIVIPCHRVVGQDGSMTGYTGGLARKQALLALERRYR